MKINNIWEDCGFLWATPVPHIHMPFFYFLRREASAFPASDVGMVRSPNTGLYHQKPAALGRASRHQSCPLVPGYVTMFFYDLACLPHKTNLSNTSDHSEDLRILSLCICMWAFITRVLGFETSTPATEKPLPSHVCEHESSCSMFFTKNTLMQLSVVDLLFSAKTGFFCFYSF